MPYFDPNYFKKKKIVNRKVNRSIKNKTTRLRPYVNGTNNAPIKIIIHPRV